MLSRLIAGVRVSLGSVVITLALTLAMGIVIGGAAGFLGGRADQVIMRITDVFLTFPTLVLALFMVGMLGTGLVNVILAIALSHWAWYARIVRGIVMSLRHREFLLAARMSGAGPVRTFWEHLLPATFSQLVVLATLDVGHIMLHVSGLSFSRAWRHAADRGMGRDDQRCPPVRLDRTDADPVAGAGAVFERHGLQHSGDALRDSLDPHLKAEHSH